MRRLAAIVERLRGQRRTARLRGKPFYVAHPFESPLPIDAVDQRGLIDDELRVFYNRIPKVGNTTLVFSLAKIRTGKTPDTQDVKKDFRRPSHLSKAEVSRLQEYLKIIFVRDPFSRVLSAYLNKIVDRREPILVRSGTRRPDSIPSFREFCAYLADGALYDNVHWAPQTSLMLLPLSRFDIVGRFESFEDDARKVLARLGAPDRDDPIVTFSPHATRASDRVDDFYDPQTRAIVRRLYRADFEALGY